MFETHSVQLGLIAVQLEDEGTSISVHTKCPQITRYESTPTALLKRLLSIDAIPIAVMLIRTGSLPVQYESQHMHSVQHV
jgi:hypothetical protein